MHKWSSRTFRICFHSQMWETQIWWIDQKCRLLLNIIRVRGYRKKINIPSIEHSTDEHPKFHLYRTTLSCKSVYGQVGQPCTGLATIRVHTVTNTSYSRLVEARRMGDCWGLHWVNFVKLGPAVATDHAVTVTVSCTDVRHVVKLLDTRSEEYNSWLGSTWLYDHRTASIMDGEMPCGPESPRHSHGLTRRFVAWARTFPRGRIPPDIFPSRTILPFLYCVGHLAFRPIPSTTTIRQPAI